MVHTHTLVSIRSETKILKDKKIKKTKNKNKKKKKWRILIEKHRVELTNTPTLLLRMRDYIRITRYFEKQDQGLIDSEPLIPQALRVCRSRSCVWTPYRYICIYNANDSNIMREPNAMLKMEWLMYICI